MRRISLIVVAIVAFVYTLNGINDIIRDISTTQAPPLYLIFVVITFVIGIVCLLLATNRHNILTNDQYLEDKDLPKSTPLLVITLTNTGSRFFPNTKLYMYDNKLIADTYITAFGAKPLIIDYKDIKSISFRRDWNKFWLEYALLVKTDTDNYKFLGLSKEEAQKIKDITKK